MKQHKHFWRHAAASAVAAVVAERAAGRYNFVVAVAVALAVHYAFRAWDARARRRALASGAPVETTAFLRMREMGRSPLTSSVLARRGGTLPPRALRGAEGTMRIDERGITLRPVTLAAGMRLGDLHLAPEQVSEASLTVRRGRGTTLALRLVDGTTLSVNTFDAPALRRALARNFPKSFAL